MRRPLAAALLCSFAASGAEVDPALVGSWRGEGIPLELTLAASGACSVNGDRATCAARAGDLSVTDEAGEVSRYRYAITGGALVLSGGDLALPLTLRRTGGAPAPAPASKPGKGAGRPPAPASDAAEGPPAPRGPGTPFSKEAWGLRLQIPPGWKAGERGGALLLGSDTEAGLVIVRFLRATTRAELESGYAAGLQEEGVSLAPAGPAEEYKAPGGKGLAGELSGSGQGGAPLRARTIALLTRWGGAAVVLGITSAEKYPALKARAEAVAQSLAFTEPKGPKGAAVLAGRFEYVYVSPTGGYSRESKITLCADGRFNKGGEMSGSGAGWGAATAHGNAGTWTSDGDGESGQLTLRYDDGRSETLGWRVSHDPRDQSGYGPAVVIGSTKYQRSGGGDCR